MELRRTFDEDEANYERARPGYADELYEAVFSYAGIGAASEALEIGIGTGQATTPFLNRGCRVTAVELGARLASFSEKKFADFRKFEVKHGDFMELPLEQERYDLVYAATAFHWLPPEACGKVWNLLKYGGAVALFWNRPFVNCMDDPSNVANRKIYEKYRPGENPRKAPWGLEDCRPRLEELRKAGFSDVEVKLFHRIRTLSAEDYIALLNTYSDHRVLPLETRQAFERDMLDAINEVGGRIRIYDTMDLYLGRKK